jgi:hypothetical protein
MAQHARLRVDSGPGRVLLRPSQPVAARRQREHQRPVSPVLPEGDLTWARHTAEELAAVAATLNGRPGSRWGGAPRRGAGRVVGRRSSGRVSGRPLVALGDPSARREILCDMSQDTSQMAGDRRLWLEDGCPRCGAQAGARCRERSASARTARPRLALQAARGWRQRAWSACAAGPGERCVTPRGRRAARPHAAWLCAAREELHAPGDVFGALDRAGAQSALVRFAAGARRPATLQTIDLKRSAREPIPGSCESELAGALAAPIWGRYGSFRGQPAIRATLTWNVAERSLVLAGTRAGERFKHTLHTATSNPARAHATCRATRRGPRPWHQPALRALRAADHPRARESRRATAAHAADKQPSRARLRAPSGRADLKPPERCARCDGAMPTGLRPEARYCSKHCRQAASRARLALTRRRDRDPGAGRGSAHGLLDLQPA